jgi:hypothetical protein
LRKPAIAVVVVQAHAFRAVDSKERLRLEHTNPLLRPKAIELALELYGGRECAVDGHVDVRQVRVS